MSKEKLQRLTGLDFKVLEHVGSKGSADLYQFTKSQLQKKPLQAALRDLERIAREAFVEGFVTASSALTPQKLSMIEDAAGEPCIDEVMVACLYFQTPNHDDCMDECRHLLGETWGDHFTPAFEKAWGSLTSAVDTALANKIVLLGLSDLVHETRNKLGREEVACLAEAWASGGTQDLDILVEQVFGDLVKIAHRLLRTERSGDVFEPDVLVAELYLRLRAQHQDVQAKYREGLFNPENFYGYAARLMRRILIDYARSQGTVRKGRNAGVVEDKAVAIPPLSRVETPLMSTLGGALEQTFTRFGEHLVKVLRDGSPLELSGQIRLSQST